MFSGDLVRGYNICHIAVPYSLGNKLTKWPMHVYECVSSTVPLLFRCGENYYMGIIWAQCIITLLHYITLYITLYIFLLLHYVSLLFDHVIAF